MHYRRMPIEIESPEAIGYGRIRYNLAESSVTDAVLGDLDLSLKDVVLEYGDHKGRPGLRQIIASDGDGVTPEDVLMTIGAAAALFIVNTSLLKAGDRMVVLHPNYATNVETPRALGAEVVTLPLRFEDGFRLDLDALERSTHTRHAPAQPHLPAQPDRRHDQPRRTGTDHPAGRSQRFGSAF